MSRVLIALAPTLLLACGEKAAPAPTETTAAAPAASEPEPTTPGDSASKAFAKRLLATPLSDFRPGDSAGVDFVYGKVTFRGDNTFVAEARISIDGESMDCAETGTWTMDPASDNGIAAMTWSMAKTTCAGRPATLDTRVQLTADGAGWKIEVR